MVVPAVLLGVLAATTGAAPFSAFGYGPAWARDPGSAIHRFATDSTGVVRTRVDNGDLAPMDIRSPSPASATSTPNGVVLAWRGSDDRLFYKLSTNNAWGTPHDAGGRLIGSPVPIYFANALRIFGLGPDGMIRMWTSAGWSDRPGFRWNPLLRFAEVPYVFVRGGNLVIWATGEDGVSTWEATSKDGESFSSWIRLSAAPRPSFVGYINGKGSCTVNNHSGSSDAHVLQLLAGADAALGVQEVGEGRTRKSIGLADSLDRFYVGRYYAGWIDQTGFYGELNGLWVLNGRRGVELDFVVAPNGEPLNSFIPGELNDGKWGPGYSGAEHIEEPVQDQGQWGLDEAGYMYGGASGIEWWRTCNGKGTTWTDVFLPYADLERTSTNSREMTWEAPFVKVADYLPGNPGETCGDDYYFDDNTSMPVKLRVGLQLFGDNPKWYRTYQYVNPAGNPVFNTQMNLITGTAFGYTPPRRAEHAYTYVRNGSDPWEEMPTDIQEDIIVCGEVSISTTDDEVYGSTFRATGGWSCYCNCFAHGGIELGGPGGLPAVSLAGGTSSDKTVETFEILGTPPDENGKKYTIAKYDTVVPTGITAHARTRTLVRRESEKLVFAFPEGEGPIQLRISRGDGSAVHSARLPAGQTRYVWDASLAPHGVYVYSIQLADVREGTEFGALAIP